jgi:Predicted membrane protein (DUF2207)
MTMKATLSRWYDRAGHGRWQAALLLPVCLLAPSPAAAAAAAAGPGDYAATRFDVNATVLRGGSLAVTETIAFDFQSGTFQKVWREIPTSRTDGIEIVEARMDGETFPRGTGPGHIVISGGNRVRVEWQFAPAGPSTHLFELRYVARGVAYREDDRDVVRWRLLPAEHRYRIAESRGTIVAPVSAAAPPALESRRVDRASSAVSASAIQVLAGGVSANGWIVAEVHYPKGSIVTTLPDWQQRRVAAAAMAPRWGTAAVVIWVIGVVILVAVRQSYPSPALQTGPTATTEPPDALPAALVAALAAKGRRSGFQSVATLLDLADRGVLVVRELPRKLGTRNYELAQVPGKHDLADHEAEALTIAFAGAGDDVTMSKARARLARGAGRFARAVNRDLAQRGLQDPDRKAVRDRLTVIAIVMLVAAGVGCIGVAPLIPRLEGWPFLLPLALAASGIVGVVMAAATTSLSDAGLLQSARWRGFRRHLKEIAGRRDDPGAAAIRPRWIVYGIALGLASQWSRYLKKHPDVAPSWFIASAHDNAGGSFAAFVGSGAASTSGAGAGGGAAGGGGSGAG